MDGSQRGRLARRLPQLRLLHHQVRGEAPGAITDPHHARAIKQKHSQAPRLILPGIDGGCLLAEADVRRSFEGAEIKPSVQPDARLYYVAVLVLRHKTLVG